MSTAKMFVPASLIMALATVVLGAQTSVAEPAADECKTTPGSSAPPGQHWYYRVNRSDQRHCWYLGAEEHEGACADARKGIVITGAAGARGSFGNDAHHAAAAWRSYKRRPSRRRLANDRRRQRLLGPRSISRKPLIRPRASRRPGVTRLRRRRRTRRRKCRWCGRSSPKPSVPGCRIARASPLPGQFFSSPLGR